MNPACPCPLKSSGLVSYTCPIISAVTGTDSKMTPHWCNLYIDNPKYKALWNRDKPLSAPNIPSLERRLIGDQIERALTAVGITSDRVSKFLGRPCGCKGRKEKLNRLHAWAIRVMGGHVEEGKRDIEEMLNE